VGPGALPGWHTCYSTVVPNHPDWPASKIIEDQRKAIKEGKITSETERLESLGKKKKGKK
jgi:hypothetical protein